MASSLAARAAAALRWPTFTSAVLLYYWSLTIFAITYHVRWLDFRGKRNDVLGWALGMKACFRYHARKVGNGELFRGRCIYLCNHRSWADFVVDQYVTEGRSMFMSRWAVVAAFPAFMLANWLTLKVLVFRRDAVGDKERFNAWIDATWGASCQAALGVYPEGHRATGGAALPLKRGMLRYAHSRSLPVQVVITANKEALVSERHATARLCQTVATGYSPVVYADAGAPFEAFLERVQAEWDALWRQVFSADAAALPELRIDAQPSFEYPRSGLVWMAALMPLQMLLLASTVLLSARFWRWALAPLGAARGPLLLAFALYVAASFIVYSQPVDALALHRRQAEARRARANGGGAAAAAAAPSPAGAAGGKLE